MKLTEREKAIYQVTWAGSFVNFLLVVFKFIAGILGHSAAMIADAVHSLSDFATDIVVLIFTRISNKPQDKNHDYGHGKYETLATAIIGIVLFAVGAGICWNGLRAIQTVWQGGRLPVPGMLAFAGAIISIVSKELIYRYTIHVGRKINSNAVIANAWHHRSDAFSSIGTAMGIGGAIALGESWSVLDPMAAVIVSFFIMKVSVQLLKPCVDELTEKSLPDEIEKEICLIAENTPGVSAIHNLRTRRIGNHYAIEMHVRMDGHLTLYEAHAKASVIENKLKEKYGNETHVGIHVEPVKDADGTYRK
ncbi:MAG TPA: cation-efflux pump [Paraprevotella xylaniphila]|jgi:cation diffusion facilitator family transporter|uniref:cation diffusion facilitator family transporter n=1 Tax=Paraprevotella xylaniphila TaxID=454155 RepID=UPI000EBED180|nr:cation diffusion facilitator family transporter [Paraprevotella xylaniphila]HAC42636.1 cation-efflux pump [Paraprevotella xylaniphila]